MYHISAGQTGCLDWADGRGECSPKNDPRIVSGNVTVVNGSLRERRPGVWELIVSTGRDPLSGRYLQTSRTFAGSKRQAQRALAELVTDIATGRGSGATATVTMLLEQWLDHTSGDLSPTTLRTYRQIVRTRLIPAVGNIQVRKLQAQQLDDLYRALVRDANLSPTTVRQIHSVIRRALSQAVKWGWISQNVATNATPPRITKPDIGPPPIIDVLRILEAAYVENEEFGTYLHVVATTGLRRGEACALRWTDIDLTTNVLNVQRSIVGITGGGYLEKDTKTHAARKLAIDSDTQQKLVRHHTQMEARARQCNTILATDAFIFSEAPDCQRPWYPDTPTARFTRLRQQLALPNVRLHDLRHMHATQLLAAGVPIRTVSGRLGHANAATTLNVYAHFLEASDQNAATIIRDLLRNNPT